MARPDHHERRRVGLVGSDGNFVFVRQIIRGISRYAYTRGHWVLHASDYDRAKARLENWRPHGVICMILPAGLRAFRRLNCPMVNTLTSSRPLPKHTAGVAADNGAIGRLAAGHLLDRGFRLFAFCAQREDRQSRTRLRGFRERLKEAGVTTPVHTMWVGDFEMAGDPSFARSDALCVAWLRSLPKPVGVFACEDVTALKLALACQDDNMDVLEEVALLGAGNDDVLCCRSPVPLSSVDVPGEQVGYLAAELLDELMSGGRLPSEPILVPPQRVVTRASTDLLAIEDPDVVAACRFIRENYHRRIDVSSVVGAATLSRRILEQRFKHAVGRTLGRELTRVRVEHAKRLLMDTELSMPKIAERIGLANAGRLSLVFRRVVGMTPSAYRQRARF